MAQANNDKKKKYVIQGSDLKWKGERFAEGSKIELTDDEAKMLSKQIKLKEV